MKCFQCDHPLAPDAKFCPRCGAKNQGTANFCANCGQPVEKDAKFCTACGTPVTQLQKDEEKKTDLSTSMADIAIEVTEKVLEKVEGDNHSTHFEEMRDAKSVQEEKPARSETPAKPQSSPHTDCSAGGAGQKIKRNSASVREAAAGRTPGETAEASVEEATQAPVQAETAPVTEQTSQQTNQAPATRRSSPPVNNAAPVQPQAPVGAAVPPTFHKAAPVAEKVVDKMLDTTKEVVKEGAKKLSVGKTIAVWAAVAAFVIGAATACLNFFVSPPEDTVETLIESVDELDYEKLLSCFDSKTEKQIRSVMGITGDLFGSLTGINLDLEDLMTFAPSLESYLEIPDLGIESAETVLYADCSKNKLMEYCLTANNGGSIPTGYLSDNEIINFLSEYHISLPGLENLIAEVAVVKITLKTGEVGYLPLINEGWGDWRIPIGDMISTEGLG